MRRIELNQSACGGCQQFGSAIQRDQAIEFCLQDFPHTILESDSLGSKPLIERRCNPIEILEEPVTILRDAIVSIHDRIETRLVKGECIDPTLLDIKTHAISTDFYQT